MHGRALRWIAVVFLLGGLPVVAACGGGSAQTQTSVQPPPRVTALVIARTDWSQPVLPSMRTTPGGSPPQRIWVVPLEGSVASRTVLTDGSNGARFALSPDGRTVLYPSANRAGLRLRTVDLRSGAVTSVTASGDPYGWGWDSDGRIVVVTATTGDISTIWQEIRPLRDVVVWRGKPGRLTSATVETTAAHIDIEGLIAADKDTAYFGGRSWPWGGRMAGTVWRFDFASHQLTKVGGVVTLDSDQWKAGRTSESIWFPFDTPFALGGDVAKYGLPRETDVVVKKKYPDGYVTGTVLQRIDLLRLSDMHPVRSIVVTPAVGFEVSRRLVFNADFSRYLEAVTSSSPTANRSESSERETVRIVEVDPSTSQVRAAVSQEDTAVRPLGYVGRSGAFAYLGEDATGTAVFLQEPGGKKPRAVLRLRDRSLPWGDDVRLLGVQYSR